MEYELPLCLLRANEQFAEGWLVTGTPLSETEAELLSSGDGAIALVLPIAQWHRLGTPQQALTLELEAADGMSQPLSPQTLREGIGAVLEHHAAPPPWLRCVSTRPGGILAHFTVSEAAHELMRRQGGGVRAAALRRIDARPAQGDVRAGIETFCRQRKLPIVDLLDFRESVRSLCQPRLIGRPVTARLPMRHGTFTARLFENPWTGDQHAAMIMGDISGPEPVLVRIHSECFTGDIMGSLRCDCGPQLDAALLRVAQEGRGVVLYLRQEGRGIGLYEKLRSYVEQDAGRDTVEANQALGFPPDLRSYLDAADILRTLGVQQVRLLTNNPVKIEDLERQGVTVAGREPLLVEPNAENRTYLETKRLRMGHLLLPAER